MNRKKKINQTLIAKDKKKKAKMSGNNNKPKYIAKAERERLAQLAADTKGTDEASSVDEISARG
ncbi:hypothetical protein NFHSH190041_04320 [Shewanella sp. NFH-SH190041]|uniref:DUF2986 domain-containing protein n=1 Tax=Shewanella sp. NFH-SH190041 TaxID=2950245 RepID=UPI0021C4344A|nr:DUF2986 domain-containing protein [Shewanella sp. NFH-SH190041]BDM62980.1 hypothetical protein NFHSH190041_04320 [Shewanella sp. NFH-SH190041]